MCKKEQWDNDSLLNMAERVFDELADDIFPGETIALREVFDIADLRIQRFPMTSRISYVVLE